MKEIDVIPTNRISSIKVFMAVATCIIDSAFLCGYNEANVSTEAVNMVSWLESESKKNVTNILSRLKDHRPGQSFDTYKGFFSKNIRLLEAILSLGGTLGCLYGLKVTKQTGRKGGLLMTTFLSFIAALFSGYSKYFSSSIFLFIGRLLFGFKCGINLVLAPIYITEIVPKDLRSRYGVLFSLFITIGQLIGKSMNLVVGNSDYWPLVYSLSVFPSIIILIILPNCPESPKYLFVEKGNELECKKSLRWLRGNNFDEKELIAIRNEFYQRFVLGAINFETILENKVLRQALLIITVIMISNKVCGINGIMHYFNIFQKTSYLGYLTLICTCIICLLLVEYISRKALLSTTFTIMSFACLLLCFALAVEVRLVNKDYGESMIVKIVIYLALILHMIGYQLGIGSLIWFLPSEFFNTQTLPYAYVIGGCSNWFLNFLIILFYIPLQEYMGYFSFINLFLSNLIFAYFVYTVVPETKGRTLKEVYNSIYMYLRKKGVLL